jgi:S1-C subfamily serine protease
LPGRGRCRVGTFERTRSPVFVPGTGFVVDDGTLVVTNAHVVPPPPDPNRFEQLGVLIPSRGRAATFREARMVAPDSATDLALLVERRSAAALRIGDSLAVREGQDVLITGFPIGGAGAVRGATHRGMVAAIAPIAIPQSRPVDLKPNVVRRINTGPFDIFQLDATAYPGSSGSPVYAPDTGLVLGVINMVLVKGTREAALANPSGITYAVPARYLADLLQKAR